MFSRNVIARGSCSRQLTKTSPLSPLRHARAFASPSSTPFTYEIGESAGVKVVTKDTGSPTASLAVVVKAGSRYETGPGLAHAMEHFAFMNTTRRSALWLTREVELMGGALETSLSRENIVYKARFLRGDLPYFVELMADVVTKTKYQHHELVERIKPTIQQELTRAYSDPAYIALEAAHGVAYHQGLGLDKLAVVHTYLTGDSVRDYAHKAHNKSNIAIVGSGVDHSEAIKYVGEMMSEVPTGSAMSGSSSKYYGGESRNWSPSGNAMVVAFPGSPGGASFKPEYTILSYLLGGEPTIKWSPGSSLVGKAVADIAGVKAVAKNISYSDTGLFYIALSGPAQGIKKALPATIQAIKDVSNFKAEDLKRAVAMAKFDFYSAAEENALSMEAIGQSVIATGKMPQVEETVKALEGVSLDSLKKVASSILSGKAAVGTVGDLHVLPYAVDAGLNV